MTFVVNYTGKNGLADSAFYPYFSNAELSEKDGKN